MARPTREEAGRARARLLQAGVETAEVYADSNPEGSTFDFPIEAVLNRAGELWDADNPGQRGPISRTTLANQFGDTDRFRLEVMAALHTADVEQVAVAEHVNEFSRRLADPLVEDDRICEARADFTRSDVVAMVDHPGRTRQWFELHSRARASGEYAQILARTYQAYDAAFARLIEDELTRRGRQLVDGTTLGQLLITLTALSEGTAMRILGDETVDRDAALEAAATAAESVIQGMTRPAGPEPSRSPTPAPPPLADRTESRTPTDKPAPAPRLTDTEPSGRPAVAPTEAQLRILRLLADGLALTEIADRLGIRAGTVRTHLHRLRLKCVDAGHPVRTTAQLIAVAHEHGWLGERA